MPAACALTAESKNAVRTNTLRVIVFVIAISQCVNFSDAVCGRELPQPIESFAIVPKDRNALERRPVPRVGNRSFDLCSLYMSVIAGATQRISNVPELNARICPREGKHRSQT